MMNYRISPNIVSVFSILTTVLLLVSFLISEHINGNIVLSIEKKPITVANITTENGYAYIYPLGIEWMSSHSKNSPAKILENDKPLDPGNSMHDDIRKIGLGGFSFWHDYLYFSTSDNSDPRTNGRKYYILWSTPIKRSLCWGIYISTFAITLFTSTLIMRFLWVKICSVEKDLSSLDKLIKLAREHDKDISLLLLMLMSMLVTGAAYFAYMLLYKPVQTIARAENSFIYFAAYLICCFMGFNLARVCNKDIKFHIRMLLQVIVLIGTVIFLLLRPETDIREIFNLIARLPFLLFMIFLGVFMFLGSLKYGAHFQTESMGLFRGRRGLLLAILFSLILATPGIVKPIIANWDISGWMDSCVYDNSAHKIATGEIPEGNSIVMPLYQYGLALIYCIFGHFFYIQQIVNVLMAEASIILICLSAWNLFRNLWAVLFIGILSAFTTQLHQFVYSPQIENWYIPLICTTIFAWSSYWRHAVLPYLFILGVSIGLALNCRIQGIFYFVFLCFAPFFISRLTLRTRFVHSLIAFLIVGFTLLPWSVRNYIYLGRFSPSSDQSKICLLLNDHRLPLYAQRYELKWREVLNEYKQKYDDDETIKRDFLRNTFGDPVWLAKAVFWRSLGFYGLLPPGVWAPEGPGPTDWSACWQSYVYWGFYSIFFIIISLLGFLSRPCRLTLFLFLAICANLILTIAAPMREPRYGYPVVPLHMLMGLCAFFTPISFEACDGTSKISVLFLGKKNGRWLIGIFCTAIFLFLVHLIVGRDNLHRPLVEKSIVYDTTTHIDQELSSLNELYNHFSYQYDGFFSKFIKIGNGLPPVFKAGDKIRFRYRVSNNMLPPKTGDKWPTVPGFASDPRRETYYFGYPRERTEGYVGVTYCGAISNCRIREDDWVEIEGSILLVETENQSIPGVGTFWIRAEKICKVDKK